MSELGTVEKKSIVAHFDDENITKVVLDADERLLVTVTENGKEKSMGFLPDGSVSLPAAKVHVINESTSNSTYRVYDIADHGLWVTSETVNAGTVVDLNRFYEYDPDGKYYTISAVGTEGLTYSFVPENCVNCYIDPIDPSKAIIIDPTVNAAATVICSNS